jgi:hypothetical protein
MMVVIAGGSGAFPPLLAVMLAAQIAPAAPIDATSSMIRLPRRVSTPSPLGVSTGVVVSGMLNLSLRRPD